MRSIEQLPKPYIDSKSTPYRKRIAAMAKPLPDKVAACIEMGETIFRGTPNPHELLVDIPAFLEALDRCGKIVERHGIVLPDIRDPATSITRSDKFFRDNGVLFDGAKSRLYVGPLLLTRRIDSVDIFVAALKDQHLGAAIFLPDKSSDGGNSCRIILDAVSLLEEAIFRINLMRFHQPEPVSSIIKPVTNDKQAIARRLKEISDLEDIDGFRAILSELNGGSKQIGAIFPAFGKILILKFIDLMIRSYHSDDDIEHTINLFNLMARCTVITQLAVNREGQRIINEVNGDRVQYDESAIMRANEATLDFVGWLANIAYGDPFFRISDIQLGGMSGETESGVYFKQHGMPRIFGKLGITFTPETNVSGITDQLFSFLCSSKERLQVVARAILDEYFEHYTGKSFEEVHPGLVGAFKEVNETEFLTRDDLPTVSEIWKVGNVI